MKKRRDSRIRVLGTLFLFALCSLPSLSHAAGPWKGQVVDRETQKPIAGAVVLMVWYKHHGIMDQTRTYHDSEESVTDAEGHFTISSRWYWSWFVFTNRPDIYVFKGGYGRWEIQDYGKYTEEKYPHPLDRRAARLADEGAVLELSMLKTRQERIDFQGWMYPSRVPYDRMPYFLEAYNAERRALGLSPVGIIPPKEHKR